MFLALGIPLPSYQMWKHTSKRNGGKPGVWKSHGNFFKSMKHVE